MMKSRIYLLIGLALLMSAESFAAQDEVTSSTTAVAVSPDGPPVRSRRHIGAFVDTYPLPILSGGMGVALEYSPWERFSLWGHINRFEKEKRDEGLLGPGSKAIETKYVAALRFFPSGFHSSGWYFTAGHKWGDLQLSANPGLFRGPSAQARQGISGTIGGLGYRLQGNPRAHSHWVVDIALNYEPGNIKTMHYQATGSIWNGTAEASIWADTEYGVYPEAHIGLAF